MPFDLKPAARPFPLLLAVTALALGSLRPVIAGEAKVDPRLISPAAEFIPAAALQPAINGAVASGLASLLARATAPENDTHFVFPPVRTRKVVSYDEKQVPHKWVTIKEPTYQDEYKDVDQLVPIRDQYGTITGYERKMVKVLAKRTQVGTHDAKRLVADPAGDVMVTKRSPIYGPGGPDVYPHGMLGCNGMALYVFARAGLGDHPAVRDLAQAMIDKMMAYGIPDYTFDVAWMSAGFSALGRDSSYRLWSDKLISRLIDGQIRDKGDAAGLWGPVCIHYTYIAKFFDIELLLRDELKKLEDVLSGADAATLKSMQPRRADLANALTEVVTALRDATSQGKRLMDITNPWKPAEDTIFPGLPVYIYNRILADVDSTANAAFAIAEAERVGILPKETRRVNPRGKKLLAPESTDLSIKSAIERLAKVEQTDGAFTATTLQQVNTAFDTSRTLTLMNVPFQGAHPALVDQQSLETNVNGSAALLFLGWTRPDLTKTVTAKVDPARVRAEAVAKRWYGAGNDFVRDWPRDFTGKSTPADELLKNKGILQWPAVQFTATAIDQLPCGGSWSPYSLMPSLVALARDRTAQDPLRMDLYRQLAYRLLALQGNDGQWRFRGEGAASVSSAEDAVSLANSAENLYQHLSRQAAVQAEVPEKGKGKGKPDPAAPKPKTGKDPKPANPEPAPSPTKKKPTDDFIWLNQLKQHRNSDFFRYPVDLYPTLASLVLLVEGLNGQVSLDGLAILPLPPTPGSTTAASLGSASAPAVPAEPAGPMTPAQAASGATRSNPALFSLYEAVLKLQGEKTLDAPPLAAPNPALPAVDPQAPGTKSIDDLLGPAAP